MKLNHETYAKKVKWVAVKSFALDFGTSFLKPLERPLGISILPVLHITHPHKLIEIQDHVLKKEFSEALGGFCYFSAENKLFASSEAVLKTG